MLVSADGSTIGETMTDDDGTFVLDDVPPGTYSLLAWHGRLGKKSVPVTLTANGTLKVNVEYSK